LPKIYQEKYPKISQNEIKEIFRFYNLYLLKENLIAKAYGIKNRTIKFPFYSAGEILHCNETDIKGVFCYIRDTDNPSYLSKLFRADHNELGLTANKILP
jgi:hypothetical protein